MVKYSPLVDALELANPGFEMELLVFCLGDRSLLDSTHWKSNWESLCLPERGFRPFCTAAALVAQQVASDILTVYNAVLKNLNAAPGPRPGP